MQTVRYDVPRLWISYDPAAITSALTEAKSAVLSLKTVPYQRRWVETLQQIELKREVAGTSRIEGAEFSEGELDAALKESPAQLFTRSQRQAHAAAKAYRWISQLPADRPVNAELIQAIHRQVISGADDDHCPPGRLRSAGENVTFGRPIHRGAEGGEETEKAFTQFSDALQREFRDHDPLIQAIAAHYHLAAMHPFLDGNGRTARALEALLLQRAGLRDSSFIAMSNYYYEEKPAYLSSLAETRARDHDLTPFLLFALKGIALQCQRLLAEIQRNISKELFRNLAIDLFGRLKTPRKRVIAERQLEILRALLDANGMELDDLVEKMAGLYKNLRNPTKAVVRDIRILIALDAIRTERREGGRVWIDVRLEWPTQITETEFFEKVKRLPKAKSYPFL